MEFGRSQNLPDANWLLTSNQASNTRNLALVPLCAVAFFETKFTGLFYRSFFLCAYIGWAPDSCVYHLRREYMPIRTYMHTYIYLYLWLFEYWWIWMYIVVPQMGVNGCTQPYWASVDIVVPQMGVNVCTHPYWPSVDVVVPQMGSMPAPTSSGHLWILLCPRWGSMPVPTPTGHLWISLSGAVRRYWPKRIHKTQHLKTTTKTNKKMNI
jgi:hypothetical protein